MQLSQGQILHPLCKKKKKGKIFSEFTCTFFLIKAKKSTVDKYKKLLFCLNVKIWYKKKTKKKYDIDLVVSRYNARESYILIK